MKLLHSKTASKAGSSLWIPSGRGRLEILAKIEKGGCEAAFFFRLFQAEREWDESLSFMG
jgi:hypothetical protein